MGEEQNETKKSLKDALREAFGWFGWAVGAFLMGSVGCREAGAGFGGVRGVPSGCMGWGDPAALAQGEKKT